MAGQSRALRIGDWVVDPDTDTVARRGERAKLEPRAMRLLLLLAQSPGVVVSVDRMLNEVWPGVIVGPASVYQAVSQLRRLLGDTDPEPTYIATIPRKGYRLIAAVQTLSAPAAAAPASLTAAELASAGPSSIPNPSSVPSLPQVTPPPARRRMPRALTAGAALAVLFALAALLWRPVQRYFAGAPPTPSIVVLPFIDMTDSRQDQSFCDGLTEELSNWLAQIPTLRVVARTSAFAYRGRDVDVRTIGKELGASHVLEGSLRRSGNQLRITAQLVSTRDGFHLWSANFDRPIDDVVKVQEEIARSVADNLEIRLTEQTGQGFAARRGGTPQAYQLYLLARHHQHELTRDGNDRAIELYRQALALDDRFALAYAGLASAYINQSYLNGLSVAEVANKAEPVLATALRLDRGLPDIYTARGALRSDQGRNDEALRDLRHAIDLNPNDSEALTEMGYLFIYNGQPRDALASYGAAATLDPLNFNLHARRCIAFTDMARFDEADLACTHARALAPDASWAYVASSWLEWARGRIDAALKWNELALKASPNEFTLYKDRSNLLLSLGLAAAARTTLEQARAIAPNQEAVAVRLARVSYYQGGTPALRSQLSNAHFDASKHADTLLLAARLQLLLHDAAAAKRLLEQALAAPDLGRDTLDNAWIEREGDSNELTMAISELWTDDRASALRRLDALAGRLALMMQAGIERYGVYELRAELLALRGDADGAMFALHRAADLGWRDVLQAEHDPAFASLRARSDYRVLIERLNQQNLQTQPRVGSPSG
ncbi:MAG: winged helix-turn-helix domain-containing tetratricopeptide repeat protein [Steroidobacterales bacterium]